MAYAQNQVIKTDDLGKILTNGNAEVANYNLFSVTVQGPVGENSLTKKFTTLYSRGGGSWPCAAIAQSVDGYNKQKYGCLVYYELSLSGNTFSVANAYYTDWSTKNITMSIAQIRGLM